MKKFLQTATLFSILFFGLVVVSSAAPWKAEVPENKDKADTFAFDANNLYVVDKQNDPHNGIDLVMKAGKGGVVHQWFEGTSEKGPNPHGDHSVWRPVGDSTECPNNWHLIENPDPAYGEHFADGENYCVKTNQYNPAYFNKNN